MTDGSHHLLTLDRCLLQAPGRILNAFSEKNFCEEHTFVLISLQNFIASAPLSIYMYSQDLSTQHPDKSGSIQRDIILFRSSSLPYYA